MSRSGAAFIVLLALPLASCSPARMASVSRSERTEDGKKVTHINIKIQYGRFTFTKNEVSVSSNDPLYIVDEDGIAHIHQFDEKPREILLHDGRSDFNTYGLLEVAHDKVVRLRMVDSNEGTLNEVPPETSAWLEQTLKAGGMAIGGGEGGLLRSAKSSSEED